MHPSQLDGTHVQQLLAQLLVHGFGELRVRVHNHVIASIVPMPLVKDAEEAEGVHLTLTSTQPRVSVSR